MTSRSIVRGLPLALVALALAACKPHDPNDASKARRVSADELPEPEHLKIDGLTLSAAGVEMTVPKDWKLFAEDEANFALAFDPREKPTFAPACSIELRRQGPGPLPRGAAIGPTQDPTRDEGIIDYAHGPLRARMRSLPGPTPDARVFVQCRAGRSAAQWKGIDDAFASLHRLEQAASLPPLVTDAAEIVQLCAGTPARRTLVCARKRDGAVYCGASTTASLNRIAELPPAVDLACDGPRTCIRDGEDQLWCWLPNQAPVQVAIGAVASLAQSCLVGRDGEVRCAAVETPAKATATYAPLLPLDDPKQALHGVEALLPGSSAGHGCVLREGAVWCWDRDGVLPIEIAADQLARVDALPATHADALRLWAGRLCAGADGQWTCTADTRTWTVDGCERRACGCSLLGAARLSCEHEPHERVDIRAVGRVDGVVAVDGSCAALLDGRVFCRGPLEDGGRLQKAADDELAGGLPGIGHMLALVEEPAAPVAPVDAAPADGEPTPSDDNAAAEPRDE